MRLYVHQFGDEDEDGEVGRNCAANIRELLGAQFGGRTFGGVQIDDVAPFERPIEGGVVLLNGHGGPRSTELSYDSGYVISARAALKYVVDRVPARGEGCVILWAVCYSAVRGHIAHLCKSALTRATVMGSEEALEGALASLTGRGTVRSFVIDRLVEV